MEPMVQMAAKGLDSNIDAPFDRMRIIDAFDQVYNMWQISLQEIEKQRSFGVYVFKHLTMEMTC